MEIQEIVRNGDVVTFRVLGGNRTQYGLIDLKDWTIEWEYTWDTRLREWSIYDAHDRLDGLTLLYKKYNMHGQGHKY